LPSADGRARPTAIPCPRGRSGRPTCATAGGASEQGFQRPTSSSSLLEPTTRRHARRSLSVVSSAHRFAPAGGDAGEHRFAPGEPTAGLAKTRTDSHLAAAMQARTGLHRASRQPVGENAQRFAPGVDAAAVHRSAASEAPTVLKRCTDMRRISRGQRRHRVSRSPPRRCEHGRICGEGSRDVNGSAMTEM
jgi:hypothetical protein